MLFRSGPLKGRYIYDAMAEPAHKGGRAEINIRERDDAAPSPRGVKAFRVTIAPTTNSEETSVLAENLKLPEETAGRMKASVAAWSIGQQGCDPETFKGAWAAAPENASAPAGADKKTAKVTAAKAKR